VDCELLATCKSAAHRMEEHTRGLGKHSVVLKLRLPQRRSVASNDDELGLAGSQALEGGLVAKGDPKKSACRSWLIALLHVLARLHHKRKARVDGVGGSLVLLGGHLCAQECICKVPGGLLRSGWILVDREEGAKIDVELG
jgi:hypothetical protein